MSSSFSSFQSSRQDAAKTSAAFTLIELLVCISIIALLLAILMPSLSAAQRNGKALKCLANLRGQAEMTAMYLQVNDDHYPTRTSGAATGGQNVFGAFMPTRTILSFDRRPAEILSCTEDADDVRLYKMGSSDGSDPGALGIGDQYGTAPDKLIRIGYGINNMTGIPPTTPEEKILFNPYASAYKKPAQTLMYADCAWVNARGHNVTLNDAPELKGRVANAAAPQRMDKLSNIPASYGQPQSSLRRHRKGSNIAFMDLHGEMVNQEDCFKRVLYSWTEN